MTKRPWSGFVRNFLAAAILCLNATSQAQQASDAAAPDPSNKQLLERISELEAKVKQLEDKQATATPAPAPAPEPVAEIPRANTVARASNSTCLATWVFAQPTSTPPLRTRFS
jgi:hypothetical protein